MVAPSQAIKVLIANDETPARNRLKDLISDIEGVTVVAEATNGKEA
ncbi:MAG: two-component system response regulator AlgR, partial [Methylophilaceae bacterium]